MESALFSARSSAAASRFSAGKNSTVGKSLITSCTVEFLSSGITIFIDVLYHFRRGCASVDYYLSTTSPSTGSSFLSSALVSPASFLASELAD